MVAVLSAGDFGSRAPGPERRMPPFGSSGQPRGATQVTSRHLDTMQILLFATCRPPEPRPSKHRRSHRHFMDSPDRWRINQVLSINAAVRQLKKEENSLYNCICSILTDAAFVEEVT